MTNIYPNYSAFWHREDRDANGVSQEFAGAHPNYAEENESNKACWNCFDCSGCSGCSGCSDCFDCFGCSGCSDCFDCSDCSDCSRCSGCSGCSDLRNAKPTESAAADSWFQVPVIPEIHSAVLKAASAPEALNMSDWHTCETTHCRAGWVVTLAGEPGKRLEEKSSTLFAAMQIYKASSPIRVNPGRFFDGNEEAMADMRKCAEQEATAH